jgi:hypothetical protein
VAHARKTQARIFIQTEDGSRVTEKSFASGGELDGSRTTKEQRAPGFILQSLNLRADGGLGGIQQLSRVREPSALSDGHETAKQVRIKHIESAAHLDILRLIQNLV